MLHMCKYSYNLTFAFLQLQMTKNITYKNMKKLPLTHEQTLW